MKRATFGIAVIVVLAVPIAVATDWVTDKEAEQKAAAAMVSDTTIAEIGIEHQTETIRIFPSF